MASIADLQLILKQKHIPTDISHDILCMVFQMEHRDKVHRLYLHDYIMDKVHKKKVTDDYDLEITINFYFDCNCCMRHQYNKPRMTDDGLTIVTKSCVFNPSWVYDYGLRWNEQGNDFPECDCQCRRLSRWCARKCLVKTTNWGPIENWPHHRYTFGRGAHRGN